MPGARGPLLARHSVITRQPGVRGIITLLGADTDVITQGPSSSQVRESIPMAVTGTYYY